MMDLRFESVRDATTGKAGVEIYDLDTGDRLYRGPKRANRLAALEASVIGVARLFHGIADKALEAGGFVTLDEAARVLALRLAADELLTFTRDAAGSPSARPSASEAQTSPRDKRRRPEASAARPATRPTAASR